MYKLRLGTTISPVIPLGFKDGAYRYGINPKLPEILSTLKSLGFYSVDVDCCRMFVPQDFEIYDDIYYYTVYDKFDIEIYRSPGYYE